MQSQVAVILLPSGRIQITNRSGTNVVRLTKEEAQVLGLDLYRLSDQEFPTPIEDEQDHLP